MYVYQQKCKAQKVIVSTDKSIKSKNTDFHHFEVKDIYADRGISGKSMNRPDLQRMLKDAKEGNIDCVMVYKTNRLARNTSDLLKIVEDLHKQNVEF